MARKDKRKLRPQAGTIPAIDRVIVHSCPDVPGANRLIALADKLIDSPKKTKAPAIGDVPSCNTKATHNARRAGASGLRQHGR